MERLIRQMLCTTILTGVGVFCLNSGMASTSLENQSANSVGSQQVQAASLFNPDPVAKGCTAPICKEVAEDDVKMLTKKCASKTTIPDKEKALDTRYLMYPSGKTSPEGNKVPFQIDMTNWGNTPIPTHLAAIADDNVKITVKDRYGNVVKTTIQTNGVPQAVSSVNVGDGAALWSQGLTVLPYEFQPCHFYTVEAVYTNAVFCEDQSDVDGMNLYWIFADKTAKRPTKVDPGIVNYERLVSDPAIASGWEGATNAQTLSRFSAWANCAVALAQATKFGVEEITLTVLSRAVNSASKDIVDLFNSYFVTPDVNAFRKEFKKLGAQLIASQGAKVWVDLKWDVFECREKKFAWHSEDTSGKEYAGTYKPQPEFPYNIMLGNDVASAIIQQKRMAKDMPDIVDEALIHFGLKEATRK